MIYFVILFFFFILMFHYDILKRKRGKVFFYNLSLLILVLLAGFRYRVGGDTLSYMVHYDNIPNIWNITWDELLNGRFDLISLLFFSFTKIFDSFYVLQIIHAIFVNTVIFVFIKKNTNRIFLGVFLYYVTYFFYFNMEIIRESIAISFFLFSLKYYYKKKWIWYYLYVALAFLSHSSAIIFIFLPLFRVYNLNYKYVVVILFVFVSSIFFKDTFLNNLQMFYFNDRIAGKIDIYQTYTYTINGLLGILIFNVLFPIFVFYLSRKYKIESPYYNLLILYAFIGASASYFFIFYRFLNYLSPIMLIFYVEILGKILFSRVKHYNAYFKLVTFSIFLSCIIIVNNYDLFRKVSNAGDIRWYSYWYPYHSILDEKEDEKREIIWREWWLGE